MNESCDHRARCAGHGDGGGPAKGGPVAGREAALRFNSGEINSAEGMEEASGSPGWSVPDGAEVEEEGSGPGVNIIPEWRGGKLDPVGGKAARLADLRRFEEFSRVMRLPFFLTLTLDRERFGSPEAGYHESMRKLSELLTRHLGCKLWGRVIEVQADSGEGWVHWHVLVDLAGSRFDQTQSKGRPWTDMSGLRAEVIHWWCDEWKLGGIGGQDVQPVEKRGAIVGYLCKYVVKPWPAIPQWVLRRKLLRTVGFSRAANEHFRAAGLSKERSDSSDDDDSQDDPQGGEEAADASEEKSEAEERKPRQLGTILERVASSGLSCKVVGDGEYVGRIDCPLEYVVVAQEQHGQPIGFATRVYHNARSVVRRGVAVLVTGSLGVARRAVQAINRWVQRSGLADEVERTFLHRLNEIWDSWEHMQAAQRAAVDATARRATGRNDERDGRGGMGSLHQRKTA